MKVAKMTPFGTIHNIYFPKIAIRIYSNFYFPFSIEGYDDNTPQQYTNNY